MSDDNNQIPKLEAPAGVLPVLPARGIVAMPNTTTVLQIGREKSIRAIKQAVASGGDLVVVAQREGKNDDPGAKDLFDVGTLGSVWRVRKIEGGHRTVFFKGRARVRLRITQSEPWFGCEIEALKSAAADPAKIAPQMERAREVFAGYAAQFSKRIKSEVLETVPEITDPEMLADLLAAQLRLDLSAQQELLETTDPAERLKKVCEGMASEMEVRRWDRRIRTRVQGQIEKSQKEYYLNEQMRAIQKELGERDEFKSEISELEEQLKAKEMPDEARERSAKELKKLKLMSPMSAEATVVRNYVDWLLALPWLSRKAQNEDLQQAERVLNEDHFGLEKAKQRILEFLAVQSLVETMKGPILCLVGPPGVGKTSLGRSIARATGRDFVRISLGGVHDEAEIRGHRRTYIGALPGKILQGLKKAGSGNPIFLLDEVDKMSSDFRGDPASALLEVLDPEQNHTFNDHYLDMDYDLSSVMFVCTANVLHEIPRALQDRMEIIQLPGYIESEKLQIARKHLVRKQLEANGLTPEQIEFTDGGLLEVIRYYTRESGVRGLEREIAALCRKTAREVVAKGKGKKRGKNFAKVKMTPARVKRLLGVRRFRHGEVEEEDRVGLCTGLAYTEAGGELLHTEVAVVPGKGKFAVTGRLGEVMQESANAAMSYVRSRAKQLGLAPDFYSKVDVHIHVPEGATPKDGPSAGITIATAVASALTRVPIRANVAMTGEITLRGRVLPIGGLKEKLIAAHRSGVDTVVIPQRNEKDLKEIPAHLKRGLNLLLVDHMDEVFGAALALEDVSGFLQEGDHVVEAIFDVGAAAARMPGAAVAKPAPVHHPSA